jgi:outer membrane protein assembly factor BamB
MFTESPPSTIEATSAAAPVVTSNPARLRWWAAFFITLGVLPYGWGRTAIVTMSVGRPEQRFLTMFLAGFAAVAALTWRLGPHIASKWRARTRRIVFIAWILSCASIVAWRAGAGLPRPIVAVLFTAGSFWVPWVSWLGFDRVPLRRALGWSVVSALGVALMFSTLAVREMLGDTTLSFGWTWSKAKDFELQAPKPITAAITTGFEATPDDFTQYLGPNRDGVLPSLPDHAATDWTAHPPKELWRITVGPGWSGFATRGDYAFTQEQRGDEEYVVCYRITDGSTMWSVPHPTRFHSPMGGTGPRATPTITSDGFVYTLGGTGFLQCIDGRSGEVKWSVDALADNNGSSIAHGVCGSPLVDGNRVIVTPTGNDHVCLVAYHRETGKRLWQAGEHAASYSSPTIVTLSGRRLLLFHAAVALEAHDPETGEFLWEFPWSNEHDNNCSQPIVIDAEAGRLLVSSGYGQGAALIEAKPDDATWNVATIWTSRDMRTKFTTAIRVDDAIYGLDDGILACIDLSTGKRRWKSGRYGHGQILLVGKTLLVQAENGDVALVDPQPKKCIELSRIPVLHNKTWNNPTVAGRHILVRNAEEAVCLEWPTE